MRQNEANSIERGRFQAEHQDNSAELREAFKIFDRWAQLLSSSEKSDQIHTRDGNGFIDAAELKKVAKFIESVDLCMQHTHIYTGWLI